MEPENGRPGYRIVEGTGTEETPTSTQESSGGSTNSRIANIIGDRRYDDGTRHGRLGRRIADLGTHSELSKPACNPCEST